MPCAIASTRLFSAAALRLRRVKPPNTAIPPATTQKKVDPPPQLASGASAVTSGPVLPPRSWPWRRWDSAEEGFLAALIRQSGQSPLDTSRRQTETFLPQLGQLGMQPPNGVV